VRAEITDAIRNFIETESPDHGAAPLSEDSDLVNEWFVDSMTIVSLVAFLEERFGVEVRRADINGKTFKNLRTLTDYVIARQTAHQR
jgi:acyl carrier protein